MSCNIRKPTMCVSQEDSDEPRHQFSLIRVFTIHMKKAWVLSFSLSAQGRLWSEWAHAQGRQICVFAGRTPIWLVLSCLSSCFFIARTKVQLIECWACEAPIQSCWYILKQKSYVRLTCMSVSSKCMNAFHSNFHLANFDHLEMICI